MRINYLINLIITSVFVLITVSASAIVATVKGSVSTVHEASGIDFTGGSSYWTHNDGYGDNKLYKLSNTGALLRTVVVSNAVNWDWEDLASDNLKANMYIGDFGNNTDDRTNLRIYKIPHPSSFTANTVTASVIKFSYPDQHRWPSKWLNFDAEAFFHLNGLLYIFTKADGNAIGHCKLYTVPDQPGTYTATFIDSFPISGRITSADISPDGKKAVLISNTCIYLFCNFTGKNVFTGTYRKINIDGGWTQKEGVCFNSASTIYMVDEGSSNKLYEVNLSAYLRVADEEPVEETQMHSHNNISADVFPNPAQSFFTVRNTGDFEHAEILLTDMNGRVISIFKMEKMDAEVRVETEHIPNGIYFVQLIADNDRRSSTQLIVSH